MDKVCRLTNHNSKFVCASAVNNNWLLHALIYFRRRSTYSSTCSVSDHFGSQHTSPPVTLQSQASLTVEPEPLIKR